VEDDRFTYVGPLEEMPPVAPGAQVIEAEGMAALPGLVNAHTHAAMTLFRSYADDMPLKQWLEEKIWPREAHLTREDIYWGTKLALAEMIRSGTTTFADMYFHMDGVARAVLEAGVRACLCEGLIGNRDFLYRRLKAGVDFALKWRGAGEGRITTMLGPHAPYTCPEDYLKRVAEEAAKHGLGIHIHLAETSQEVEEHRAKYGLSPVLWLREIGILDLPLLAAHCVHLEEKDMEVLAEKGVKVAHCPESNLKLASGVAPVASLLARGVNVALGTDGAASNNNLDMLEEARTAALLSKGISGDPTVLPAPQALHMATLGGARALNLDKEIGSLEAGKKADFILIDLNQPHLFPPNDVVAHLVYSASGRDVDTVVVDGKILMHRRELKTLDLEEIYFQVKRRMA